MPTLNGMLAAARFESRAWGNQSCHEVSTDPGMPSRRPFPPELAQATNAYFQARFPERASEQHLQDNQPPTNPAEA